jgi:hypothetical protein
VLGRQVRSAHALAAAARAVCDIGIDAIADGRAVLDAPRRSGPERLALLARLRDLAASAGARLDAIDYGPGKALVRSLADARDELVADVADLRGRLRTAEGVAGAAESLLRGPRATLVIAANNAEMRAGSGMFLSAAPLRTSFGNIALGEVRSVTEVTPPAGAVGVTGDLHARWGWLGPADEWRNLMLSPRFDEQASLAAEMWRAAGRPGVDGVLVVDPAALRAILRATGPVRAGGRTIGAGEVLDELLYRQYVRFAARGSAPRREALGAIARAAFDALDRGGWDPVDLIQGLAEAAGGRHLMLWSRGAAEQDAWRSAGLAGSIDGDSLLVAVCNEGGNKLDRFLRTGSSLTIEPEGDGARATLRVRIANRSPADAPAYVAGPNPSFAQRRGEYVAIVAVTLPGFATEPRIRGGARLVARGPDGAAQVIAATVRIEHGGSATLVVRFALPQEGILTVEPSARIPAVRWDANGAEWRDDHPRAVTW